MCKYKHKCVSVQTWDILDMESLFMQKPILTAPEFNTFNLMKKRPGRHCHLLQYN